MSTTAPRTLRSAPVPPRITPNFAPGRLERRPHVTAPAPKNTPTTGRNAHTPSASSTRLRLGSLRIVPGEFPPLVDVSLVFLVEVDADLGGIVAARGPPLELSEEALGGRLGVRLSRRHAGEHRDPLFRRALEEWLAVELTGQSLHCLKAGAPQRLPVGLERFCETAVDVAGHAGGARPGGMVVGGDDQLGELIQQRVLRCRQELAWDTNCGLRRDRPT